MRLVIGFLALLSLTNCGDTPCGCPFGTVCQPDYSKPDGHRCIPAPHNSEATDVPATT